MKLIALALAAMFSSTWTLALDIKPGDPRCDLGKASSNMKIPPAASRAVDGVCHKSVWDFLDLASTAAADKKKFGTLADANGGLAEQKVILQKYVDLFQGLDAKEKAAADAAKAIEDAAAKALAKEGSRTEALAALKGLLAKDGAPLAVFNGQNPGVTKDAALGGKLYFDFCEKMHILAKADLMKSFVTMAETDGKDYPAGGSGLSFNLSHMSQLYIDKGDINSLAAGGDKGDVCAILAKKKALPGFCSIDAEQGKRVRDYYLKVRGTINAVNASVKASGKPLSEVVAGMEQAVLAEEQAGQTAVKAAFEKKALATFQERIGGMTAEELFDGASLARYQKLSAPEQKAELEKVRSKATAEVGDFNGERWLVVNGKKQQKIVVPEGIKTVADAEAKAAEEGKKIADAYIQGNDFKAEMMSLGYAVRPAGSPADNNSGSSGAVSDADKLTGCDSLSDIGKSDVERVKAKKLDAILAKKKVSAKEREAITKELTSCIEKSSDSMKSTIDAIAAEPVHPALNPDVARRDKANRTAAEQANHQKRVILCEEFAAKQAEKLQDLTVEAQDQASQAYLADNTVEAWFLQEVTKGSTALKADYKLVTEGVASYRLSTLSQATGWAPGALLAKLPGKDLGAIDSFFKEKWTDQKVRECAGKLGYKRKTPDELLKEAQGQGLKTEFSATDATAENIDSKCGVATELPAFVKGLTGKLGTVAEPIPVGGVDDAARKKRCEELKKKGITSSECKGL